MIPYEEKSWEPLVPSEPFEVKVFRILDDICDLLEQISEKLDKPTINIRQPSFNRNPYEPIKATYGGQR